MASDHSFTPYAKRSDEPYGRVLDLLQGVAGVARAEGIPISELKKAMRDFATAIGCVEAESDSGKRSVAYVRCSLERDSAGTSQQVKPTESHVDGIESWRNGPDGFFE